MQRAYTIFLGLMLLLSTNIDNVLFASEGQTLIRGTITNNIDNAIEGVEIIFKDASGKKFSTKSDSKTGKYQQLLRSGETYEIYFKRFDVLREEFEIVPESGENNYKEQNLDLKVKLLRKGSTLSELDLFDNNSSKLNSKAENLIEKLKTLLRFNRSIRVSILVSANDGKGGKKLAEARLKALTDLTGKWRKFNRAANLELDTSYKNGSNDVKVVITEVKNMLK